MKAYHTLITGSSGGGKTTLLREMHDRFDGLSVFLTTKSGERMAAKDPPRRERKSSASYPRDIERVRKWALKRPEAVQIIVDEAQNAPTFDPDVADGPVRQGLHEDRESAVKWVLATQSPQDLHTRKRRYAPVQQVEYVGWCGVRKPFHSGFINAWGLNDVAFPEQNHRYIMIELRVPPAVHGPFETKAKYG